MPCARPWTYTAPTPPRPSVRERKWFAVRGFETRVVGGVLLLLVVASVEVLVVVDHLSLGSGVGLAGAVVGVGVGERLFRRGLDVVGGELRHEVHARLRLVRRLERVVLGFVGTGSAEG